MVTDTADILVVDDEPHVRDVLVTALQDEGRQCRSVGSGAEAFDLLCRYLFDVIVSDVVMPHMDGFELLTRARAWRPDSKVILVSGHGHRDSAEQAIRSGAYDYLAKPIDLSHLRETVRRALEESRDQRPAEGPAAASADHLLRDPLTGLSNHRAFRETLAHTVARSRRYHEPFCLLLVDVNALGEINQLFGLGCGDLVLREVARRLSHVCRATDLRARYQSDVFAVGLPQTGRTGAAELAQRICRRVEAHPVVAAGRSITVTVNVGAAENRPDRMQNDSQLLRQAEEALRLAKARGRGRTAWWSDGLGGATATPDVRSVQVMQDQVRHLEDRLRDACLEATRAFVAAVEAKDPHTKQHSLTVAYYAEQLARLMELDAARTRAIRTAAMLHDIGKIGIPDRVLTKPGKLTSEELELIRHHPVISYQILEHLSYLREELPIILHHHERFDGTGYPAGLAGRAIPFGARLLHVADSIDAMFSRRSYKADLTLDEVLEEFHRGRGTQFDPELADLAIRWLLDNPDLIIQPASRQTQLAAAGYA